LICDIGERYTRRVVDPINQGVVGVVETGGDVANHLFISNNFPGCRKLRAETRHLGDILFSSHLLLLGVVEGSSQMRDFRLGGRLEHARDNGPGFSRSLHVEDICKDVRGDGVVEPPLHELIVHHPSGVDGVGHGD
jgi:hypothetical protein